MLLLPAASALPSKYGLGPLSGDIALLYSGLSSNQTNIHLIAGLLHAVITGEADQKIWTELYGVIVHTRPQLLQQPTTPPQSQPSFTSSFQQTPWSFNTGSFADASEHRRQVDDALREELLPTLRIDVPDFIPAVFGHISRLDELAEMVFDRCQEEDIRLYTKGSGWTEWPMSAKEDLVLDWLHNLMKRFVAWMNSVHPATSRQIYKGPSAYLDGSPIKRKMDVGIMGRHGNKDDEVDEKTGPKSSWAQILVAGELKSNPIEDGQEPAWLDLATYAREVFRTQDRRFVLGFTLCGSRMRLWHFDRSGSSGSSSFDINQEGLKYVHVMLGYHLMDDEQLGLDPTIQQSDGQRFVEIIRDNQIERLILIKEIRKQAVVAGRATTCWRAYCNKDQSKEPLVVKDSWQYEERAEEGELIKEATDKGARNIARYYHHETVQVNGKNDDTIDNVRRGSMKTFVRTRFRQRPLNESDASASASDSPRKTIAGRTQSPSLSRKRSSSTAQMAPPASFKRSCSSFESWNSGSPIHNRVHRRVITRDFGKPIYEASSPSALITGLIGAIKGEDLIMKIKSVADFILGHESLLNSGILHRDVSVGNIMLTENEDDGFLIDYDLAIRTSNDRASGAPGKTGTKVFMAIGALLGEPHSFMHDLESFFWVLFWICIHYEGRNEKGEVKRRIVPQYEDWNYLSTERLANLKAGQISKGIFDTVDDYFTEHCKPLIPCLKELHKAVFVEGSRWFSEHRELYSDMKRILEKARDNIKFEAVG